MSTAPSCRSATSARIAINGPRAIPLAAAALLAAGAAALTGPPARAAVVEEIVAKVNNRIITASEFDERQKALYAQVSQEHPGSGMTRELQDAQEVLLANIITEALLLERAATVFDMDRIRNTLIEDFRKQQNIPDDAALDQALKDQQMTRRELEDHLIRLAVPNEIINYDVKRKISVSETEIKDYYAQHQAKWETPASVTFKELVLLYTPDTREETAGRARAIVADVRGGAGFDDLVMQHTESGSRETQGLVGPMAAHDLQPALAAAVAALQPGQVSDPVDTGRSFHILRLESRTERVVRPLAEVHDEVQSTVREEKFRPRFDAYLRRLWKENHIEVSPKYESWLVVTPLKPKPAA